MIHRIHNNIISFIWGIADDVLRDVYVRGKYRDVILPMIVIRRLDILLEPTKAAVLQMKKTLDQANIREQDVALRQAAGESFYNISPFTLRDLKNRAKQQQLKADFEVYLDGFSPNVQEILANFQFRNQIPKLMKANILGDLIGKFLDPKINLSPKPIRNADGDIVLPALDNHAMGTIFEELIRRFNEENNEEAGEHFTPRDVIRLMTELIFLPIVDKVKSGTYLVYDGACGTGGMLTLAEERFRKLAAQFNKEVSIHVYGQEVNPETYAIAKADFLIKGEGEEAENIKYGSTLSSDAFPSDEFDFMLSNPPYGKSWKGDLERLGGKKDILDPRFVKQHAAEADYKMITRSSDGQMMFLINKVSKMRDTELGSRIAEVHNGSSLFTGDAGQGESNIRRWIIENDLLETIIALPENMFYNTGIATYIWLLSNRKSAVRKGKVQLIDASQWYVPLRRNLGKKNCELSQENIAAIVDLLLHPRATEQSKIFPNQAFGYWKITVERPLRLRIDLRPERLEAFYATCQDNEPALALWVNKVAQKLGATLHHDWNSFIEHCQVTAKAEGMKLAKKQEKILRDMLCESHEAAAKVIKKVHKKGTAAKPLYGLFSAEVDGKPCVVEYESDTALRDNEQVPLLEDGGIEAFFQREVLPYVADAWIDGTKTQIGYEISFTRHFYKPVPMRSLEEIKADIFALEQDTEGLLEEIMGEEVR